MMSEAQIFQWQSIENPSTTLLRRTCLTIYWLLDNHPVTLCRLVVQGFRQLQFYSLSSLKCYENARFWQFLKSLQKIKPNILGEKINNLIDAYCIFIFIVRPYQYAPSIICRPVLKPMILIHIRVCIQYYSHSFFLSCCFDMKDYVECLRQCVCLCL